MNNLFSVFDPQSSFNLYLNWVSAFILLLVFPQKFWLSSGSFNILYQNFCSHLHKEIKMAIGQHYSLGLSHMLLSLVVYIGINNLWGLFPYVFTASSHLSFSLGLALPLWLGLMTWSTIKSPNSILAHLVPLGTPSSLMPFMVLIELVSSIIRPITLSVRLAANMVAGHLLMVLLSNPMVTLPIYVSILVYSFLLTLSLLELGVSFIQSYVFSTLLSLYIGENVNPLLF